jgi:branched-chain amino acid transport system ATP-binding protein
MLKVQDLQTYYGNIRVLHDVSIDVNEGEMVALIGSNGAGKTTFLMSICGILKPARGTIEFLGTNIFRMAPHKIFKTGMVQVPQETGLFPEMTVLENLKQGAYRAHTADIIDEKLEEVYGHFPILAERHNQKAGTLSGGERQMLGIGRALMAGPTLLLLDEPGSGLAPLIVENLAKAIANFHKQGLTIFLVELNAQLALEIADRGYVLENGEIVLSGKSVELMNNEQVKIAYMGA